MNPSIDLFIFADALGWELVKERGFLEDLLPHRGPCETLFGYSSTCDPSILTGRLPFEHGHFSFFVYDPPHSPFGWARRLSWLPENLAGHRRLRNVLSRWCGRQMGYTGYFQLYGTPFSKLPYLDYTEKKDIYEPGGINGGQEAIFAVWDRLAIPWRRSDWRKRDAENIAEMAGVLDEGRVRCAYLFTGGLDAVMHAHTTRSLETDRAFAWFDDHVRKLHEVACRRYREVRLHLFSDHGMTDTQAASDMMIRFEGLGLKYAQDYAAVWDSTMVRFWFLKPGARDLVVDWLKRQPEGSIVSDEQLKKWHCFFESRRFGELFYLLEPGTIFVPCYMSRNRVPAMHGFSPEHPTSKACWLSSHVSQAPPRIEGIFNVMVEAAKRA